MKSPEYGSKSVEFSTEFLKDLKEPFRAHYPKATAEAIINEPARLERLKENFPEFTKIEVSLVESVTLFVEEKFRNYLALLRELAQARETASNAKIQLETDTRYQDLMLLCWVAGTVEPMLDGDWSIGRVEEIEKILSIDSFTEFQKAQAEEKKAFSPNSFKNQTLGSLNHLHLGPGNGVFMQHLRDSADSDSSKEWREIGLGLALLHNPTETLEPFIKKDLDKGNRAFMQEVLLPALRKTLQDKWFDRKGDHWVPKPGAIFDNNDIYEILKNPAQWLDPEARVVEISTEYENDARTHISPEAYETGLRYMGIYTDEQIQKKRLIFEISYWEFRASDSCAAENRISADELHRKKRTINKAKKELKSLDINPEVFNESAEIKAIKEEIKTLNQAINPKQNESKKSEAEIEAIKAQLKVLGEKLKATRKQILESYTAEFTLQQGSALSEMFTSNFMEALMPPEGGQTTLNLNRHIKANPHNFVPGSFTDLPKLFPGMNFALMSDIRSASHEDDVAFQKDIFYRCKAAAPGDIFFGDGFKQSYSRVMRLPHIHKAIKEAEAQMGSGEFYAVVVMDTETHTLKNVVVQRKHENGHFTLNDSNSLIRERYDENVYFKPLADFVAAEKDPIAAHTEMLNYARRIMLRLTKEGKDNNILDGEHDRIKVLVTNVMGDSSEQAAYTEDDLEALQSKLIAGIKEIAEGSHRRVGQIVQLSESKFEIYAGGRLDTYPNPSLTVGTKINRHYQLKMGKVPDMSHFEQPEVVAALERKKQHLIGLLRKIESLGIASPLVFVNFSDCVTNEILWERLRELVGTNFAQEAIIDFKSDDFSQAQAKIAKYIEDGGILIGGGSWENVDEAIGAKAKQLLEPVVPKLLTANSQHTALGICFSYQILADLIGKIINPSVMNSVGIEAGMFEFGAIPISRGQGLHDSPLFADCPKSFAIAHTHGRHLVDHREGAQYSQSQHLIAPAATSLLTKQPVGFISSIPGILKQGSIPSIIGLQGHPEVRLNTDEDTKRVEAQLKPIEAWLESSFGIDVKTLNKSFDEYTNRAIGLGHTQEAGDHLLVNALTMLAEGLLNKLKVSSTL